MKSFSIDYTSSDSYWSNTDLKLTDITYIQAKNLPDWSFSLHSHKDALELSLVLDGKALIYCDGKSYTVTAGDLVIKNAHILHAEETDKSMPIEQICLSITGIHLHGLQTNCLIPDGSCPVIKTKESFPLLKQLFLYLLSLCQEHPNGYKHTLQAMVHAIISSIRHLIPETVTTTSSKEFPVIKDVINYLDKNYYKNITLDELAKKFYFSSYYLARKFKEETGYTINQYVINRRMGEAERMLLFEDLSIKEIAKRNGYTNLQHFYSTFKKYAGCTPVEFKNLYLKQERNS